MDAFYLAFYWQGCHHWLSVNIFLVCFFPFLFSAFCVTSFSYMVSYNQPVHIFVVKFTVQLENVQKQQNLIHSYLLECKRKVLIAQSTLCDAMDYTAHQAPLSMELSEQEYVVSCHSLLQGIFLTQGLNPDLLHCRLTLYSLSHQGLTMMSTMLTSTPALLCFLRFLVWAVFKVLTESVTISLLCFDFLALRCSSSSSSNRQS